MRLLFEWDPEKAKANLRKHGVTFEEGATIFNDPHVATALDEHHSEGPSRFISIGSSQKHRLLLVVHGQREQQPDIIMIRIISCRKATPLERTKYEEGEF